MKKDDFKILYLSSFPPRECGLATFCYNLIKSHYSVNPYMEQRVIAVNEMGAPKRDYPSLVRYSLYQEELESYNKASSYVNESGADIFFLQHEYGIFGGFDGVFILKLLEKIKIPIVTFLHTVPVLKESKRRKYRLKILKDIAKFSKYIIVTAKIGKRTLVKDCKIPENKIIHTYHGALDVPYPKRTERNRLKKRYKLKGKFVMSTFGLISRGKGLDYGVEAMAKLSKKYPNLVFLILGESHPVKIKGWEYDYYSALRKRIKNLNISNNVLLVKRYLNEDELANYLRLTDVYLIPYLTKTQISSGTLAYAMATGNCIISTPFTYAKELIGKDRGYFIDFENSSSIVKVISNLIENPKKVEEARRKAYNFARKFTWEEVAKKTIQIFKKAIKK